MVGVTLLKKSCHLAIGLAIMAWPSYIDRFSL